ncbi:hypothetical protein MP228_006702 [Amoeboaphelidium protococcarum]|nr:hypothetical protein MP228_006702 [Amoeboaphelidium protococcarum]
MLARARSTELLSWHQFLMDEPYHSTTDLTLYAHKLKLPLEIISMIFDYVASYQQIYIVDERSFSGYLKQRLKLLMSLYGLSVIVDTSLITTLTLTVEKRDLSYQSTLDGNSKHSSVQFSWNPFFDDYFQLRQLNICHSIFPWLAQPQLIVDASLLCVERIHTETLIKVDLADTIFDCKCLFMDITITMWTMEQVVEYEQLLRLCPQVTLTITEASKFKGIAHECRKMQRKVYNLVNYYGNFYVKGLHESLMCDVDQ